MTNRIITTLLTITTLSTIGHGQDFYRSPDSNDSALVQTHADLITANPTDKTVETYYSLAQALWTLQRNEEAKSMFLKIVESEQPKFNDTYYHASDIPGDTTTNIYGYGSFTSNYKNSTCLYLTKIFIEQKNFADALKYLTSADKQYTVDYNCGTGHNIYQGQLRHLYGLCYEGLGQTDEAIDLLLPHCFDWQIETIVRIFKAKYSQDEIKKHMDNAVNSITCMVDTFESKSYVTRNYGTAKEEKTELTYTSGTGTMDLFGKTITLPRPNLENGETVTRQLFIDQFLASRFYQQLTGDYSHRSFKIE